MTECSRQFATFDPGQCCWRTLSGTSASDSAEFWETWPVSGTWDRGGAYERLTSVPRTNVAGSSSPPTVPTPTTQPTPLLPTPDATHGARSTRTGALLPGVVELLCPPQAAGEGWGRYAPAIEQWEKVVGRPAPEATEPDTSGKSRLSPRFVEWMMGLPAGHVTNHTGRTEAFRGLGNGVVPQQVALYAIDQTVLDSSAQDAAARQERINPSVRLCCQGWTPPLLERSPRVDDVSWAVGKADAQALGDPVSVYVRRVTLAYLAQGKRFPRPPSMDPSPDGVSYSANQSLAMTTESWEWVRTRSKRDRTTMGGVVATAIWWAHGKSHPEQAQ